jgi:PAS domain S-box-containing protein
MKVKPHVVAAQLLALAAIYYLAARLGLSVASVQQNVSPVWPPTGVAIAAMLLLGYRMWPAVLVGAFFANLRTDAGVAVALGIAAGNTLEALCATALLRRLDFHNSLDRAKDIFKFVLAAVVATMVAATIGNLCLAFGHAAAWDRFGSLWSTYWLGDLVGALTVGPLLLTWLTRTRDWLPRERYLEGLLVLLLLSVSALAAYGGPPQIKVQFYPLARLIVPFFVWAAFRLGRRGVTLATVVLSVIAVWGTAQGKGPYAGRTPNESLLILQLFLGSNAVTFLFLVAVVEERQASEKALRQREQQLNVALDAANMGAWDYEVKSGAVRWSSTLEAIHGIDVGSFGGTFESYLEDVHPDDHQRVVQSLAVNLEQGGKHEIEYRIVRPDGKVRWVEGKGRALRNTAGKTLGMTGVCMDVTERKRADEEREQLLSREQVARVEAETATEKIKRLQAVADTALQHLTVDDLLDEMLARVRELLNVESVTILLLSDDGKYLVRRSGVGLESEAAKDVRIEIGRGIAGRIAATRAPLIVEDLSQVEVRNPVLSESISSLVGAPLVVNDRVIGVIHADSVVPRRFTSEDLRLLQLVADRLALALDHANLYEAEQKARIAAEEASRTKDEFLATVSHELRTPLNAIVGWSGMLRGGRLDAPTAQRAMEIIDRNARVQTQLIEDILDVSRIITGKLRLETGPVELLPVIEAAIDSVRPALDSKSITLDLTADAGTGPVLGDAERLQQVIWNLLSNAVKFTPANGCVAVRLRSTGSDAEIVVRDTGQGITEAFLPYVFDRFRQADGAITRKHGGLGLGLAIVRHLVELHGGVIAVESAGEGQGATFVVRLPMLTSGTSVLLEQHELAVSRSPSRQSPFDLSGLKVLVVDDEADARDLLATILMDCDARVQAVSSAREALVAFANWRPDAIISDLEMPEMDGYAFIREVRTLELAGGSSVPAVALTAYARVEDRLRALAAGFQIHISKPADPLELATVVASLTGRIQESGSIAMGLQMDATPLDEKRQQPEALSVNLSSD